MTDCERLSDRMPLVALERDHWSAGEQAHLGRCHDCQAEWELVRAAGRLEWPGLGTDAPAIAGAVLTRLRVDRARSRRRHAWAITGLGVAAAAALALWFGGRQTPRSAPHPVETAAVAPVLQVPIPELDDLQAPELDRVLQQMDAPLAGPSTLDAPSLGDLDDHELDRLLNTWEG
jgi:hypothetical protein